MLEPGAFLGGRAAAQDLEAAVDLDRVAGDGDGILAALAQALRDGDRDRGLADRVRPEDREDLQGTRRRTTELRAPPSVKLPS
jgi:hypothetical protein